LAPDHSLTLKVVNYLDTPPTRQELQTILERLSCPAAQLVRNDKHFKALRLVADDYRRVEDVIDLLQAHPELMQRPIALYNGKAAIGRPPEDLRELFT